MLHVCLPLVFLAASGLEAAWMWAMGRPVFLCAPIVGVVCALAIASAATAFRASFVHPAPDPSDPLRRIELFSFVQTTTDVPRIVREIIAAAHEAQAGSRDPEGSGPARIVVDGETSWPLAWYLRGERVLWKADDLPGDAAAIVLDRDENEPWRPVLLGAGYREIPFALRGWWVPKWRDATILDLARYALTREPFGETGFLWCVLWLRNPSEPPPPGDPVETESGQGSPGGSP